MRFPTDGNELSLTAFIAYLRSTKENVESLARTVNGGRERDIVAITPIKKNGHPRSELLRVMVFPITGGDEEVGAYMFLKNGGRILRPNQPPEIVLTWDQLARFLIRDLGAVCAGPRRAIDALSLIGESCIEQAKPPALSRRLPLSKSRANAR
jgi:hypothetical protein